MSTSVACIVSNVFKCFIADGLIESEVVWIPATSSTLLLARPENLILKVFFSVHVLNLKLETIQLRMQRRIMSLTLRDRKRIEEVRKELKLHVPFQKS